LREAKKCARKIGQETTVPDLFRALVLAEAEQYAKAEKIFDSIKIDRLPPEMRNYYDLRRGIMRNFEGRWGEAKEFLESALQLSHGKQDLGGICGAIRSLVITYANLGLETQSARMVGAAEALSERSFDFWPDKQRDLYTATITKVVARLGQSLFEELKSEGYDTSIDRIVNELEWKWPPPPG
jgi:tetratricopeptide (TPR) repeat protein